jgi:hypothetical protein
MDQKNEYGINLIQYRAYNISKISKKRTAESIKAIFWEHTDKKLIFHTFSGKSIEIDLSLRGNYTINPIFEKIPKQIPNFRKHSRQKRSRKTRKLHRKFD